MIVLETFGFLQLKSTGNTGICRLADYEKISSMTDSFMRQQLLDFLYALAARYAPVQYGFYPVHLQQDACRLPK